MGLHCLLTPFSEITVFQNLGLLLYVVFYCASEPGGSTVNINESKFARPTCYILYFP